MIIQKYVKHLRVMGWSVWYLLSILHKFKALSAVYLTNSPDARRSLYVIEREI